MDDIDTELYIEEQAEIIARKAIEGYEPVPYHIFKEIERNSNMLEAYQLVAMVGEIANYPTWILRDEITGAACALVDEWNESNGGLWWRKTEPEPLDENDQFADNHL